jgi:hypothetical protein
VVRFWARAVRLDAGGARLIMATVAQNAQLQRQVLGALRPVGAVQFFDVADTLEILDVMSLVDLTDRETEEDAL